MSLRDNHAAVAKPSVARIAAVQGAPNRTIQDTMRRFARRWTDRGVRVAGLIETFEDIGGPKWQATRLQNSRSGETYPLFQNLGPMAAACHLQGAGIVTACVDICAEIEAGCDLVILSKFGQLEALRSGLLDAFIGAVGHGIPIITAVSPVYAKAWADFVAPLGILVPAEDDALDRWWLEISKGEPL